MKKYILICTFIIIAFQTFAQSDPIRQKLDSIFQHINKSQIPTGYLKEYGAEMMPLHWFNGVMHDSNFVANIDALRFIYEDLASSKIQSGLPLMTDLLVINHTIDSLRSTANTPIALLYGSYASLRDDALAQNLFTISYQQIYDVAGRTQIPYLTNTLFAATPITENFIDTVRLGFNTALYFSNTSLGLNNVSVDFKDGLGYQLIPSNGVVTKIYTDSSSTKPIDIKAQLSNGSYVYCHSSVDVTVTSSGMGNKYLGTDPYAREVLIPTVLGEGLGGDILQIRYSINNPTRISSTQHLRKPLIIVEGYDVSGDYNILKLIGTNIQDPGEWVSLEQKYDFMHFLDDIAGYDLVFVNYNTMRSFEDNSKMLQHAIEWIKQDKTAGGYTNLNVIIGVSAGGVLARYTLAKMTKSISSASTDTRLLITHDSPHQGANVPLAFQHFLYDLGEQTILGKKIKDKKEDLKNFYALNLAPATAQLLKARVVSQGVVELNTFLIGTQSSYQQMVNFSVGDNPPIYSFIATAQGSQCGIPVMASDGLPLADYDGVFSIVNFKWLYIPIMYKSKYFLKTQLNALPTSGEAQIEYFKFSRRFSLWGVGFGTKTINEYLRKNPVGFTKWDAAPGSTQSIAGRTNGALTSGLEKQKLKWSEKIFVKVRAGLNMNITQDNFSFVSTVSALDAPAGTPLNKVYIFPATGTSGTAASKYIAQERFLVGTKNYFNKNHTDFTARNAEWIYNEMEDISNNVGCTHVDDCYSPVVSLSTNQYNCDEATVTATANGNSYSWTVDGDLLINGTTTTLTTSSNSIDITGTKGFIYVSTSYACSVSALGQIEYDPFKREIAGLYPEYLSSDHIYASVNTTPYDTYYRWYVNNILVKQGEFASDYCTCDMGKAEIDCGENTIRVEVDTDCGTSSSESYDFYWICENWRQSNVALYPNPASSLVNIKLTDINKNLPVTPESKLAKLSQIKQVIIKDKLGNIKKIFNFQGNNNVSVNVSNLPTDVYFVEVSDGVNKVKLQLSVVK